MIFTKSNLKHIGIYTLLFLAFLACNKKNTVTKIDPAFAEYIESYTTGTISKTAPIQIKLLPESIKTHSVQEVLNENIFTFSPQVKGQTIWIDDRTLEFRPDEQLQAGNLYEAKVDLSKIADVPKHLSSFQFSFKTLEPAFTFEDNGLIVDGASKTHMTLAGTILTSDQEDTAQVQKILSAQLGSQQLAIQWNHDITGRTHQYKINSIVRAEKSNTLILKWNGSPIKSNLSDSKSFEVPAIGDFKLLNIISVNEFDHYAKLQFSEPIKGSNDLRGLITTEPALELSFTVQGSEVYAYPPTDVYGDYTIKVHPGIENIWNEKLKTTFTSPVLFQDSKPFVKIVGKGEIIPTTGKIILPFESSHLKKVDLTIIKIFENNIPQFFQNNNYGEDNSLRRVAKPLLQKTIDLQETGLNLNRKNRFSFELDEIFRSEPGAMYRVVLTFKPEYAIYNCKDQETEEDDDEFYSDYYQYAEHLDDDGQFWSEYDDYFPFGYSWQNRDNPCHPSFYNKERWDSRNIIASNIGIVAKRGQDKSMLVFTTNLITAEHLANVEVEILSYQQQVLFKGKTDNNGFLEFQCPKKPFLLVAKSGKEKNYLKLDDGNAQLLSRFDIDGTEATNGIKGMIYGERGVWRPGDSLFLQFILEDKGKIIPDDIPVEFNLFTPRGQLFQKQIVRKHTSRIYTFKTSTFKESPTGNWNLKVKVGGATFEKRIKIETIMPNRLKIQLGLDEKSVIQQGSKQSISLQSSWLFGAPAQNLKSKVDVTFVKASDPFPQHKSYIFEDPSTYFQSTTKTVFDGTLNAEGKVSFTPDLKVDERAPGMLKASFLTKVFEPGGAFSSDFIAVKYSPFSHYVGIKVPKGNDSWDYLETGKSYSIPTLIVNGNGQTIDGTTPVTVRLYKLEWRWWWDESGSNSNYISNNYSNIVSTQQVDIQNGKGNFNIRVDEQAWGRYLLLVENNVSGHTSGQIVYFDDPYWKTRSRSDDPNSETLLSFTSDKDEYKVNETIRLNIPSSENGKLLITIENGRKVIDKFWVDAKAGQTEFQLKATSEMAPNVYAHISLIQPHDQTVNDRPIRMYGVLPLYVKDPETILQPIISAPEVVRPEQNFNIKISEKNGNAMAYSLVIVDEGLLDITRFKTPQPHQHFYSKEALGVKTWDLYDHVMGALGGKYGRILSIGGDEALINDANANKANRFPPIVKHIGTFQLEKGKNNQHAILLPPYFGAVKVMVVAARDAKYGSADRSVTVRNPLMVQATAPRVVGPEEEVHIPVTIFATENSVKNVAVSIQTSPHIQIIGSAQQQVQFSKTGEQTIYFKGKVGSNTGVGTITVKATSNGVTSSDQTELDVRNPNPPITQVTSENLSSQEKKSFNIQAIGAPHQSSAAIELSALPPLQLKKRVGYLINYPHGCLEQIVSTAFAQLHLQQLTELNKNQISDIEKNVKATIQKLKNYQQADGSFNYWPGNSSTNDWASNYAGHFLLEAKVLGYHIPNDILNPWLNYTRSRAEKWSLPTQSQYIYSNEISQTYRLYVLALAGSPQIGAMNRLKEFQYLSDESKWRLALTYQIAGYSKQAESLTKGLSTQQNYKDDQGYTLGSPLRNKAIQLEILSGLNRKQDAKKLMEEIANELSSNQWMSTQTTAYSLLAIAKYSISGAQVPNLNAECKVNGKSIAFTPGKFTTQIPIDISKGKAQIEIFNKSESVLYVRVITEGQPLPKDQQITKVSSNLLIQTDYFDMSGNSLNIASLPQGKDFVARVRVSHPGRLSNYQNIALTTIFPSGWEIINTRVWDAQSAFTSSPHTYQDVRDDRIYTYFDLISGRTNTYYFMLNAAYIGKFYLPLIQAEAMYDNNITARDQGTWVEIVAQ